MPLPARLAVAAVCGLGAGVSFEPLRLVFLLPVAVALLTLSCRGGSMPRGFLTGTVFGMAFMLTLLPWLQVIGVDAWVGLSLLEALFYGLLGLGTAAVTRLPFWPVWVAALWVAVEAARGTIPFGGFPWGRLAFATIDTPVAPLFAYVGSAGVTFAVALVSTVLAWAIVMVRRTPVRASAAVAATCLFASLGSGFAHPLAPGPNDDARTVVVAAVQGNVPGEGMDAFAERRAVLNNHVEATEEYAAQVAAGDARQADLVIWPENSTDIDPFSDPTVFDDIQGAVDEVGVPTLVGALTEGPDGGVRNVGIAWDPVTGPGETYAKSHLVPFGEYIPFRDLLRPYFGRLEMVGSDKVPGTEPGLLDMNGVRVGDVICFEVAYDDLLRDVVRGGAGVVTVQTNNATYISTGQVEQQFAISRLRAIETGRHVVVAATNGISGIIAPTGEVLQRTVPRTQEVLVGDITLETEVGPGIRWGALVEQLLALVAALAVCVGVGVGYRRRRRRRRQRRDTGGGPRQRADTSIGEA